MACNRHERAMLDDYEVPHMNVASCCLRLFGGKVCIPQSVGYTAAKNGHIDCLRAARQLGCEWNTNMAKHAVLKNHFHLVVWMHQNGFIWDLAFTKIVARYGTIRLLKYGYEHDCPWDNTVTQVAAKFGRRDCLQFLYDHGCPCDDKLITTLNYVSKLRPAKSHA